MVSTMLRLLAMVAVSVAVAQQEPMLDLNCANGKNKQTWAGVKKKFRGLFERNVFEGVSKSVLVATLDSTVAELQAAQALAPSTGNECGLGRLNLQMLSVNTIDDPMALAQLLTGIQRLSDPVMTLLLDVPWIAVAESGWPVFGFLSQLNMRRLQTEYVNSEEADGLTNDASRAFIVELTQALAKGDLKELRSLSAIVLNSNLMEGNTLGALTALATQAAVESTPQGRIQLLGILQTAFKQAIATAPEMDLALGTRWPLWGLLHLAVDGLAAGMAAASAAEAKAEL